MTGRFCAAGALVILFLCAGATEARAPVEDGAEIRRGVRVGREGSIRAGEPVPVSWDRLPPDVEEFELLLECGSPAWGKFRLTESENPLLTCRVLFLPKVPGGVARLVLRVGRGGREDTWGTSRVFRVEGDGSAPAALALRDRGELWLREEEAPARQMRDSSASEMGSVPLARFPGAATVPSWGAPPDERAERAESGRTRPRRGRPPAAKGGDRIPLLLPLRI
jgi:hypothetical protein